MLPCTEEEVEALFYFIYNLYLTLYPIRTLSIPFPNFTAVHGVGVAQAKPACKHTIATRKCYQYNTIYKQRLNGRHLGFHDDRLGYNVENVSSAFVDLKNVYLDTKSCFCYV